MVAGFGFCPRSLISRFAKPAFPSQAQFSEWVSMKDEGKLFCHWP